MIKPDVLAVLKQIQKLEEGQSIGHDLLAEVDQVLDKIEGKESTNVTIQVIKVYSIEVFGDDPIAAAYDLQSTEIEAKGSLKAVSTEHAEIE